MVAECGWGQLNITQRVKAESRIENQSLCLVCLAMWGKGRKDLMRAPQLKGIKGSTDQQVSVGEACGKQEFQSPPSHGMCLPPGDGW